MKTGGLYRYTEAGFSIVELVLVIAIMGILMSIATINFNQWMVKNRVEAQVRQMVTDFSELRVNAFTQKKRHSITIDQSRYIFKSYSSENEDKCDGGTEVPGKNVQVNFKLKRAAAYYDGSCANVGGDTFEIDTRGMLVGSTATVFLESPEVSAAVDCFSMHTIRINPGKKDGSNCNAK